MEGMLRALAEPTRLAIVERMHRLSPPEVEVADVARMLGIDRSTAFDHLEVLREAGLLEATSRPTGRRGRPPRVYTLSTQPAEMSVPARRFGVLAAVFADALTETGASAAEAPHRQGRLTGARMRAGAGGIGHARLLERLGGDYVVGRWRIRARNCPFLESCSRPGERFACHAHAGLLEGVLSTSRRTIAVAPRGPDDTGGCEFVVHTAPV